MKKSAILGATAVLLLLAGFFSAHLLDTIVSEKPLIQANAAANGSVTQVAKTLSPSIVGIVSYGSEGDFFSQKTVTKTGSGVVLDSSGYIVTNNHVVADSDRYQVVLANSQKKSARLIGRDQRTDLALLKVDGVRLTPAKLGDSSKLAVGETVVAIGNPLGLRFARSVTAGVISGLNRVLTTEQGFVFKLIQTDAAINPGNSGGALSNLNGEVVGINTIKISVQGFEGMGFAIPSNQVKEVLKELRSNGRVVRPIAGLKIVSEITAEEADYYNLPVKQGVTITPMKNSPAAKAGLRNYDIIQTVNGHKVTSGYDLQDCMFGCKVGDEVTVEVVRIPRRAGEAVRQFKYRIKLDGDGAK